MCVCVCAWEHVSVCVCVCVCGVRTCTPSCMSHVHWKSVLCGWVSVGWLSGFESCACTRPHMCVCHKGVGGCRWCVGVYMCVCAPLWLCACFLCVCVHIFVHKSSSRSWDHLPGTSVEEQDLSSVSNKDLKYIPHKSQSISALSECRGCEPGR